MIQLFHGIEWCTMVIQFHRFRINRNSQQFQLESIICSKCWLIQNALNVCADHVCSFVLRWKVQIVFHCNQILSLRFMPSFHRIIKWSRMNHCVYKFFCHCFTLSLSILIPWSFLLTLSFHQYLYFSSVYFSWAVSFHYQQIGFWETQQKKWILQVKNIQIKIM